MAEQSQAFLIDFEPSGRRISAGSEKTLLEIARTAGVGLRSVCGGYGTCRGCRVRRMSGELTPLTADEIDQLSTLEISTDIRLACQCRPLSDVKVEVLPESTEGVQRLQVDVQVVKGINDLPFRWLDVSMINAKQELTKLNLSDSGCIEVMNDLKAGTGSARLVLDGEDLCGILPTGSDPLGLAVDLGSTKLASYLIRLADGAVLATAGVMNPQIAYGEDIVARISYTDREAGGLQELHLKLIEAVNGLADELCTTRNLSSDQIVGVVLAGNTVMHHLAAGLSVHSMGVAPFKPLQVDAMQVSAADLGLRLNKRARVYFPPNIAGYVGADHVAALVASGLGDRHDHAMLVDIGTNTEISLISNGRLYSCSCASGPAFEGARISAGMRAVPGAIARVDLLADEPVVETIDHLSAAGICGSGILDTIAVMTASGAMDSRGVLRSDHRRVVRRNGKLVYLLVEDEREITVTRRDVNEIQLAKAAIRSGMEVLLRTAGITATDLTSIELAGAFGTYLSVESTITIGMLPDIPCDRIHQIGNAAGGGAIRLLRSASDRGRAERLARESNYIELTSFPGFMDLFVDQCHMPV